MGARCISERGSPAALVRVIASGRPASLLVLFALALLAIVIAIGLLQPHGLFAPADQLAMKIVAHLRGWPGAGSVTAVSEWLALLGEGGARIGIALVLALFLARAGRADALLWLIGTVAAMTLLNPLVKLLFLAPRPDAIEHLTEVTSYSFPSGHAAGAMTLYGAIALLFRAPSVWLACAGMILATGLSRAWLGVHWPSDVIGGWTEGLAWLLVMVNCLPRETEAQPLT